MQNNTNSAWFISFIILGLALFANAFFGAVSSLPEELTVDRNTADHKYATERMRQEGFSATEAQQAADAIIKFNNAQKARKN